MYAFILFPAFIKSICTVALAGYTGPELMIPMEPGNAIRCTVETGGETMFASPNDFDEYHSNSKNGYYSIDFDDRYSGDLVLAAADGTISAMDDSTCGTANGCYVKIDHGGGYKTSYLHLILGSIPDELAVGDHVSTGDTIGAIGTTGNSNGTHLHFGLSYNGESLSTTSGLDGVELDGVPFVDYNAGSYYYSSNDGTCTLETHNIYSDPKPMGLVTISENGSAYDFHQYYVQDREYVLLNRGDMGTEYANPVILAQGSVAYHYAWLKGDVDGNGFEDIVEVQHLSSTQFSEVVWLSNGDGSFQSQVVWQSVNTGDLSAGQNHYFLGDVNNDDLADVVIARDEGTGDVYWYQCLSNGSGFNTCANWNTNSTPVTFGSIFTNNVFLLGDVTGDGKADLVRGYNTSDQTDACTTGGYKLKWRVMAGGSNTNSLWGDNWGCADSTYLLGDEDGDSLKDLVQIRFDDAQTGHVFVKLSTGSSFNTGTEWMEDFGSSKFTYYTYDVMGDNSRDALLSHGNSGKIRVARSSGTGFKRSHTYNDAITVSGSGAWLPGHYGDLALATGEVEECATSSSATISSYADGTLWDVDGTVYEYWTSDNAWHGYGSSDAFDACGSDWDSIETVSSLIFDWEPVGSVISNSFECGVTHQNDVYAWNGTVYKISGNGTKQGFTSPDVFLGCGYAWGDLDFLSLEESPVLTALSDGSAISYVGDCGYAEDLILREYSTGNLVQWTMDGSTVSSWSSLGSSSLDWEVVGAGDFNRDGSLDLLWRRLSSPYDLYAWLMDGSTVSSSVLVSSSTDSGWDIRGVFDFTYDGEPDILWKNQSSGALNLWEMDGTSYVSSIIVASATSTDWDIRAIGDLTGEGDPDILWRDSVTGALSLWDMDGASYASSITISSSSSLDWDVEAIGDYTSDGENDLLWRNPDTGDMAAWEMSGTSYVSSISMAWSSPAWDLVAAGKMAE